MIKIINVFLLILIASSFNYSFADSRYFGRSYLAYTLPEGELEFEIWNTGRIGKDFGYYYRFQPRFEFEYGVTDRLSTSLYFNFNQISADDNSFSSKPFGFSSTSIELRYRLTNPDQFIIDPALYFEFSYGGTELVYETKAIFSKRFGNLITAVNLSGEIEREITESLHESEFEITGGVMYDVSPKIALGIEFRNHRGYEGIFASEAVQATFLGPTINIQTQSFNLTFNFLTQMTGSPSTKSGLDLIRHEKYEFRTILGVEL